MRLVLLNPTKLGRGKRADVRTTGIDKIDQDYLPPEVLYGEAFSPLGDQCKARGFVIDRLPRERRYPAMRRPVGHAVGPRQQQDEAHQPSEKHYASHHRATYLSPWAPVGSRPRETGAFSPGRV